MLYTLVGHGRLSTAAGESVEFGPDEVVLVLRDVPQWIESRATAENTEPDASGAQCLQPSDTLTWLRSGDGPSDVVLACGRNHATFGPDLAELALMSRSSITEHFIRIFGQPPHDFLTSYRLRRAAQLLSNTDLSIGAVSGQVVYQSRSSFSRAFKQLHGQDPAAYRRALRPLSRG